MSAPCPACGTPLKVKEAPRHHGMAQCPVGSCGAKLVLTGEAIPFDPARHGFRLETWEQRQRDLEHLERVGLGERLLVRVLPALVLGVLTGVIVSLVVSHFDPKLSLWIPFVITLPVGTLVFAVILGQLYAKDRRSLAKTMHYLAERLEKQGPDIVLEPADQV